MGKKSRGSGGNTWIWVLGLFAVLGVGLWGYSWYANPERHLTGVQTFPVEGTEHVAPGTAVTYKTDPPTSGAHFGTDTKPGFYFEPQPNGAIVHALEHGRVVIYYDPADTPADVVEELKWYARAYPGTWDGVVVIPRSQEDSVILTAWRKMLRLKTWDKEQTERFIDAYRGRGPENPVR